MKKKLDLWVHQSSTLKKLIMELKIAILIVVTCISNAIATPTYSQVAKVSLDMENSTLEKVMDEIERQSEFYFIFNQKQIDVNRVVDVKADNKLISDILPELFIGTNVNYAVLDRKILLTTDSIENELTPNSSNNGTQQRNISGRVTDSQTGEAMPGVNIVIKGTNIGTLTNVDGTYSITVPEQNAILVFSFIGYSTQEIQVLGKTVIDAILVSEAQSLEEVVVVGYGTQKRVNLTGSVSTVSSKNLEARPVTNVTQALQGFVTGLNVNQNAGGNLSNEPQLNIRGITTIGTGSTGSPLVLIDGMEGDINTLNYQDIDNISVLKDAAASSIYGSRAPFGVILITTKKGKVGRATLNYSNNFHWNSPILVPDQMDSYKFALYFNDAGINAGQGAIFNPVQMQRIIDFQAGRITATDVPNPSNPQFWGYDMEPNDNVDWYDVMYREGSPAMEHSFNVSGGKEDLTYYISGNYIYQRGLMELSYDDYKRYNLTAKINGKLSNWATLSYSTRWGRYDVDEPSWLNKVYNFNDRFGSRAWPTWPLYDPNGYMFQLGGYDFPVGIKYGGRSKEQQDWMYQQFQLTLEPVKGWRIFGEFNFKTTDSFDNWNQQVLYNHDVNGNPVVSVATSFVEEDAGRMSFYNPNLYTEYFKSIDDHSFKLLVGFQSELSKSRLTKVRRDGIIVPELTALSLTSGMDINGKPITPTISGIYDHWSTLGYFGRINYDFNGRYLIEANLRYDGTSRFRADQRWNLLPSVSVGWNIARESFWEGMTKYINNLKIRGSYGVLGNQNTSNLYPTYVTLPLGISSGTWLVGGSKPNIASIPGLISSSLTWEKVKSYNIGIDLYSFENRLSATFDYFVRYTNDMIGPAPELPVILGRTVPRTNNTDLKTYGFEFDVSWQDRLKNGLAYNIHLLLFDSQSKILRYPNPTGRLDTYREGQKIGEIWGLTTIGIAKSQEEMDAHLASLSNGGQTAIGANWRAGDIMYSDMNGDGKIDNGASTQTNYGDLSIIGNTTPRYSFGLDLGASWKNFDFKTLFQGVLKRENFQNSKYFWGAVSLWGSTSFIEHGDYFRDDSEHPLGPNLDSYYPRPIFSTTKNRQVQSRYLQNTGYVRLKNVQLGYTLPQRLTSKVAISKLRIYVSGENIWTKTKLIKIFDPETVDGGVGGNVYPLSKIYSFGLMLTI